jgi:predicted ATPase/class 3 adenylate cyclase
VSTPTRSAPALDLPSGTVTFLFTDIEGSTQLIQRHGEAMTGALARHHAAVRSAVTAHGGRVFNVVGDAFCCAFAEASAAANAALDAQRALHNEAWGSLGELRVRMGLHTGAAEAHAGEYLASLTLVRAQRVMTAGHGGQTLVSAATAEAIRDRLPSRATLRDLGVHKLRGLTEAEPIFQLVAPDLASQFPALRTDEAGSPSGALLQELVRGRLIGRDVEAKQLKLHWERAQQARGHLVLLSGEPGIGKTRIAQELIAHAQQAGSALLRGGCYEYEATTPYLPFVEAFRDWTHWTSAEQLRATLGSTAPEIAKFAPEIESKLGALAPNASLAASEERLRLFDNVARFLQTLAAARGLLLFIDDLHWADQGTLALLNYLLRRLRNDRVLLLGAYREVELDRTHPLARALVDWNRERLATRIGLSRLSRDDTASLLAVLFSQETVTTDFAAALYRETEGNPFFVEEVVKSLIEQGEIFRTNGEWNRKEAHELTIPQSVKEAIGRRLDRLNESTVDVLRTAAALGKLFSFRELAAIAATSEDALLDALDEANGAQLIRVVEEASPRTDRFAFTHDKIREVLYEEMNPIRRRRLHQQIGETLEKLYGPTMSDRVTGGGRAQDLAHHFIEAGDLERSLRYAQFAADAAQRIFANDEALSFLEQARESAEALGRADEVAKIDELLGDVHRARGTIQPAIDHYERALRAAETAQARAALKVKVGSACAPIGDPRGLVYLEEALVELDATAQTSALALALALVGRYYHYRSQHRKAIEFLERARTLAEPLDDVSTVCAIYQFLAGAHQHLMALDRSDEYARLSVAIGERKDFPEARASGYEFLAENAAQRGFWQDALRYTALDESWGRKSGSLARTAWSHMPRSFALWGTGDLVGARNAALDAVAICESIGEERLATWLDPLLSILSCDLGELDVGQTYAERAWERTTRLNQIVLTGWSMNALGYVALMRGKIDQAIGWYEKYAQLTSETENNVVRNLSIARGAETFLLAGRLDEAAALTDQGLSVAQSAGAPHYAALARQMQGRIAAARGHCDEARAAYDEAVASFEKLGSQLEHARTLYHRALLSLGRGRVDEGRSDARAAYDGFVASNAIVDRDRAAKLLDR